MCKFLSVVAFLASLACLGCSKDTVRPEVQQLIDVINNDHLPWKVASKDMGYGKYNADVLYLQDVDKTGPTVEVTLPGPAYTTGRVFYGGVTKSEDYNSGETRLIGEAAKARLERIKTGMLRKLELNHLENRLKELEKQEKEGK